MIDLSSNACKTRNSEDKEIPNTQWKSFKSWEKKRRSPVCKMAMSRLTKKVFPTTNGNFKKNFITNTANNEHETANSEHKHTMSFWEWTIGKGNWGRNIDEVNKSNLTNCCSSHEKGGTRGVCSAQSKKNFNVNY